MVLNVRKLLLCQIVVLCMTSLSIAAAQSFSHVCDEDEKHHGNLHCVEKIFRNCLVSKNVYARPSSVSKLPDAVWLEVFAFVGNIWRVQRGIRVDGIPRALACCDDNRLAIGFDCQCNIEMYDTKTLRKIAMLSRTKTWREWFHAGYIYSLVGLPGNRLVVGSQPDIEIWNIQSGKCEQRLDGHRSGVSALAVSPTGLLISGSCAGVVKVWDVESGECVKKIRVFERSRDSELSLMRLDRRIDEEEMLQFSKVSSLAILGNDVIMARSKVFSKLFNLNNGKMIRTLFTNITLSLDVFCDGISILGHDNGTIVVGDLRSGRDTQLLPHKSSHKPLEVRALVRLSETRFASAYNDGTVRIWESFPDCNYAEDASVKISVHSSPSSTSFEDAAPRSCGTRLRLWGACLMKRLTAVPGFLRFTKKNN